MKDREPVALSAAIQTLLVAVFVLAKLFGWWHWSDDQEAGVLAAYAALTVVLASITRGKVSPV